MSEVSLDAIEEFEAILDAKSGSAADAHGSGRVTRVDADGTAWVHVFGGEGETPLRAYGSALEPGDVVEVRQAANGLYAAGNYSDPAAGVRRVGAVEDAAQDARKASRGAVESAAAARQVADEAQKVAEATNQHFWDDDNGAHVTDVTQDEWTAAAADDFSDLSDTKPYHNLLMNSLGILLRRALYNLVSISKSAIAFYDGLGNAASNIVARFGADGAQIGKTGAAHSVIDADGQRFYGGTNGATQLANIGYGEGASASGTAYAPYYTFGTRDANAAIGNYSVAEGREVEASGYNSHAEGHWTHATEVYCHAEGSQTTASRPEAHAEGSLTTASGDASHAEGWKTTASTTAAHAEGDTTTASGVDSHAEGYKSTASGLESHAEGDLTTASGSYSHAEGIGSTASGNASHAQNRHTYAKGDYQTAIGQFNKIDYNNEYALIIGNGDYAAGTRSNAQAIRWNGLTDVAGRTAYPLFVYSTAPDEADLPVTPCFVLATSDYTLLYYDGQTVNTVPGSKLILTSGNTKVYASGKVVTVAYDATIAHKNTWTYLTDVIPAEYRPPTTLYNIGFDTGNRIARMLVNSGGQIGGYATVDNARVYGLITYMVM